jgi:hypothetical protein
MNIKVYGVNAYVTFIITYNHIRLNMYYFFSDIEDPDPSDSFVADTPVTYEIVEGGTKRGSKKLVSSDGYSYVVKVIA